MKSKFQKGDRVVLLTSDLPEGDRDDALIAGVTGTVIYVYVKEDNNHRVAVCWDVDPAWLKSWWVDERYLDFECEVGDVSSEVAMLL